MPSKNKLFIYIALVVSSAVFCVLFAWYMLTTLITQPLLKPILPTEMTMTFTVAPGTSLPGLVRQLTALDLLDTPIKQKIFSWLVRRQHLASRLQAGEYRIDSSTNMQNLIQKFAKGDVVIYVFTIIEGWTFRDIMQAMMQHPKIQNTILQLPPEDMMASLGLPGVHPEGQFFPDTYHFSGKMTDKILFKRAHQQLLHHISAQWAMRSPDCVMNTPYEAMILASLIEKETSKPEERAVVSGVYQRRLRQKMLLQADPTVLYGLNDPTKHKLTHADLRTDSAYNTYMRHGLPPSPIAVSSLASLKAALHPDSSHYLYFVAKGDGGHYFSETLSEHNQAVVQYQINKNK